MAKRGEPGYVDGDYIINGVPLGFPHPREATEIAMAAKFHPNDVLLVGYPKTGNTWLQEVLWLICNNADTGSASKVPVMMRVPRIETGMGSQILSQPPGRLVNTHLPAKLLGKAVDAGKPKTIVVFRNPKDVVVSYYHFNKNKPGRGVPDFNLFFDMFMEGKHMYGDYFQHTADWWAKKGNENYLFLTYENMLANPTEGIERIAKFVGKNLNKEQVATIVDFTSFAKMQSRGKDAGGRGGTFFRKGKVGDWQSTLTEEQSKRIDERVQEKLSGAGIDLSFT